ncbi:MAG TPA: 3-deoxy-manno-octulosonate cytidylyltransferase [Bacteroidia bacterium]|nr:3-deoxy-manno-octulosonate cytidylyltransferase [Bacteroidia bacterium]
MPKKIIGIIPARYASVRFPGKPLAMIGNMSMIERVYRQALKSKMLNHVVIATDAEQILKHIQSFNGNVVMTSSKHQSGTDRCAEVINNEKEKWDVVINIQGDEPFIDPEQIDLLISCFDDEQIQIATLIKKISNREDIKNPNIIKVVKDIHNHAMYFSRSEIPYDKNKDGGYHFSHIGIYGYRMDTLEKISNLRQSRLEQMESLEQLRWLENGYSIKTAISDHENISIDTPEDLEKLKGRF